MSPCQRSKKRDEMIGAYVTPELKARVLAAARSRNMTVADYVRWIIEVNTKGDHGHAGKEKR